MSDMLNPQQRRAVEYPQAPLLVLAGAGSGKTAVITARIAHLLTHAHMAPEKIAAITFTNKAAREMRQRVSGLVDADTASALTICTFHALGLKFLRIEHARVGLNRHFSVLDADDTGAIIKDLAPGGIKPDALWQLRNLVSQAKNAGLAPEQAQAAAHSQRETEAADIYARYQQRLAAYNAVDFDDLIRLPLAALEADEDLCSVWQERLRHLLVDEYQDTNDAQNRLLSRLAGERGHFTCVGDDDQSIYAWRGANPRNLDQLARDYPQLEVVKLEQNYRCSRRILRVANDLIAHNAHLHDKQLWSELDDGGPVRVLECNDAEHEAERVAGIIASLATRYQADWQDFAVLYRGKHQARALEKALQLNGVSYHLTGGASFLDRAEVKDLLAYLRLTANPDDDAAFLRCVNAPGRGIGATTLEKLGSLAQTRGLSLLDAASSDTILGQLASRPAAGLVGFTDLISNLRRKMPQLAAPELVEYAIEHSGYAEHIAAQSTKQAQRDRRLGNLRELVDWFRAMDNRHSGGDLTAQLTLLGRVERDDPGDAVRLMTMHAAKGLEFRFVFIVGCDDGTLPHEGALDEGRLEEERRLLYVGITRARELLTLSRARRTRRYGEILNNEPSRFLAELPADDLHWQGRDAEADRETTRETAETHLAHLSDLLSD